MDLYEGQLVEGSAKRSNNHIILGFYFETEVKGKLPLDDMAAFYTYMETDIATQEATPVDVTCLNPDMATKLAASAAAAAAVIAMTLY